MLRICHKLFRWLRWSLLTITLSSNVLAQNLVLNGGFETGDFSNWTQARDTNFTEVLSSAGDPAAPSPEGTYHARLGPLDNGDIFQNFATTIGEVYRVSYFLYTGTSSSTRRTFVARVGTPGSLITLPLLILFGGVLLVRERRRSQVTMD